MVKHADDESVNTLALRRSIRANLTPGTKLRYAKASCAVVRVEIRKSLELNLPTGAGAYLVMSVTLGRRDLTELRLIVNAPPNELKKYAYREITFRDTATFADGESFFTPRRNTHRLVAHALAQVDRAEVVEFVSAAWRDATRGCTAICGI